MKKLDLFWSSVKIIKKRLRGLQTLNYCIYQNEEVKLSEEKRYFSPSLWVSTISGRDTLFIEAGKQSKHDAVLLILSHFSGVLNIPAFQSPCFPGLMNSLDKFGLGHVPKGRHQCLLNTVRRNNQKKCPDSQPFFFLTSLPINHQTFLAFLNSRERA